jgi:diamine N-acetyltransferase
MTLHLAELTRHNVQAACRIEVKPDQQKFVAPVVESIAEAYVYYSTTWPRLILDDDRVVGFVMGHFNPETKVDAFRACIWRLNIAADEQGRGCGRFAVEATVAETRRRGQKRITVLWEQGDSGPEGFYLRLGFTPTGEVIDGDIVGELMI